MVQVLMDKGVDYAVDDVLLLSPTLLGCVTHVGRTWLTIAGENNVTYKVATISNYPLVKYTTLVFTWVYFDEELQHYVVEWEVSDYPLGEPVVVSEGKLPVASDAQKQGELESALRENLCELYRPTVKVQTLGVPVDTGYGSLATRTSLNRVVPAG